MLVHQRELGQSRFKQIFLFKNNVLSLSFFPLTVSVVWLFLTSEHNGEINAYKSDCRCVHLKKCIPSCFIRCFGFILFYSSYFSI